MNCKKRLCYYLIYLIICLIICLIILLIAAISSVAAKKNCNKFSNPGYREK